MSSNDIVNSLSQWRPRIVKRCASGPSASLPDRIRSVTTLKALDELWDEHRQTSDPIVIKAFIRAGAEFGRRCPTLAEPLLFDIAGVQHLDSDDFTTLAVTTCDVSSRRLIDRLLDRTAGKLQYVAFYFGLLRCATEFLRPVDMILATDISRIMSDFKIPMFIPHARMLIHGFGRLAEPPLQALENIVDTCLRDSQGVPLDPSVLHELFAVLERMRGSYAKKAQQIALKIGAENSAKLVSSVYVRPVGQKEQTESDWAYTTYYIVDPYSVPLDKIDLPPPLLGGSVKWIILFLYSSVRSMIECNQNFPSGGNPLLEQKLQALKQLILSAPEHVFVFPAELELQLRCDGRDGVAEDTPTGRYVSFFESFLPRVEDVTLKPPPPETRMVFVTQNAPLRQSLESRIIGHTSSPVIVQADFTAAAPLVPPTATNTAAVAAAHAELNLLQQQANLRGGS